MKSAERWQGHHILITGGSSGIGLALVQLLVGRGARVSVIARDHAKLTQLKEDPTLVGAVSCRSADVRDADATGWAIANLKQECGPITDVITCAGTVLPGHFMELPSATFHKQMDINYFGTVNTLRAVVPDLIERRSGTVTCISSTAGIIGLFGYSAYSPSKFAVRGLCDSLRMELKPYGIHVSGVYPADVDTPQLEFEKNYKPKELVALSGNVRPMSAETAATAIVKGIERKQATIRPGFMNRLFCFAAAAAPRLLAAYGDSVVAKARK